MHYICVLVPIFSQIVQFTSALTYRDTAGQERFRTITTAYYRGAMVRYAYWPYIPMTNSQTLPNTQTHTETLRNTQPLRDTQTLRDTRTHTRRQSQLSQAHSAAFRRSVASQLEFARANSRADTQAKAKRASRFPSPSPECCAKVTLDSSR